jgi:hypothetical protein
MTSSSDPIQIPLTPEQQKLIRQLSGQSAETLELTPDAAGSSDGVGAGFRFQWRFAGGAGGTTAEPPSKG